MSSFEVFSYWNMSELQLVFNAIASITASGDYLGLLRTLALVGMISMAMAVLGGLSQAPDFGRWVIMLAVFNGMLLVPKVNVLLTDRTGTQGQITVANVPLGLASFASSVSHIGDWLTRTYETTFAVIPSDLTFVSHGALFGQRVQREMLRSKFNSSILQANLLDFYRNCVVPEYATGFVVASDLANAPDLWAYLSGKTNPGLFDTVRATAAAPSVLAGTYTCDAAYALLTFQINADTQQQITAIGGRMTPGQSGVVATASITSAIRTSTNYILSSGLSAQNAVKQTAMTNFMIDAQYNLPAQLGDAAGATANLAQAQAIRSTSDSYKLMATLAESTMPKVKNIIELVQYAIFPILMLIVLMLGHKGGAALKAYVMSLLWVQLWPPLYAVMSMIMTIHARDLAAMGGGTGLSMANYSMLNNAYISDEAIAGMIAATAIPAIAAAIVKGGDVGAQAIAGMVSPSREADKVASSFASGNISMGNVSLGNQSAENLSEHNYGAKPTISQGGYTRTGANNVTQRFDGSGGETIDNTAALQKIGANIDMSGRTSSSLSKAATTAETASLTESTQATSGITAAKTAFNTFDKGHDKSGSKQSTDNMSAAAQTVQSYGTETALVKAAAHENNLTSAQSAEVEAHARAEVTGGVHVPFVGGVEATAGTGVSTSSKSTTAQMNKMLDSLTHNDSYKSAVSKTNSAMHSDNFTTGDAATVKAATGIRSSLDESKSHMDSSQASYQKSQAYQSAATRTKETGAGFNMQHNNEFMDWMVQQPVNPLSNKKMTPSDVEQMARIDPDRLSGYAQKFVDQKLVPQLMTEPENTVAAQHQEDLQKVPAAGTVTAFNNQNTAEVKAKQNAAGVNPNTGPKNDVAPHVNAALQNADKTIKDGTTHVDEKGKPIKDHAEQVTNPANGSNLANAAANAIPSVLNSDAAKLLDRAGAIPQGAEAAQKSADQNTGSLPENLLGAGVAVGAMALGGVGGKAGGTAIEGAAKLGLGARKAAEASVKEVDALAQGRLAENAAGKGATTLTPEAAEAAANAEAARVAALERKVANAGAEARLETQQTVHAAGKVAGAGAGIAADKYFADGKGQGVAGTPADQWIQKTNDEVLSVVAPAIQEGVQDIKQGAQVAMPAMEQAGQDALNAIKPAVQQGVAAVKETNEAVLDAGRDIAGKANDLGHQALDAITPPPTNQK